MAEEMQAPEIDALVPFLRVALPGRHFVLLTSSEHDGELHATVLSSMDSREETTKFVHLFATEVLDSGKPASVTYFDPPASQSEPGGYL